MLLAHSHLLSLCLAISSASWPKLSACSKTSLPRSLSSTLQTPVTTDTATSPHLQLKAARPACQARSRHAPSSLGVWVTNCSKPRSPLILPPDWPLHPINSVLAAPPLGHCPDMAPRGPRTSWLWPAALGSFHLHSRQSQLVSLTASPMTPLPMGLTTSSLAQSLCVPPASSGSPKDPQVPLTHGPGSAGSMPRRPTLSPTCQGL